MTPRQVAEGYLGSFVGADPDDIAARVTGDFVNEHVAAIGRGCVGRDAYRDRLTGFLASFAGLHYDIEDVVVDGDRVVVAYTMRARWQGETAIDVRGVQRLVVGDGLVAPRRAGRLAVAGGAKLTAVEHRTLGGSGLQVSALALGTMMFGAWGNPDTEQCARMVDIALDGGINLFDSADIYDAGRSEEILGAALGRRRDDVILATKFGNPMGEEPNQRGGSRRWIRRAVEDSLRRLQTDRIDLLQMHRPDPATPFDETLHALDDLVRDGKVLTVGTSCFPAELLVEAQWIAASRSLVRPRAEQPPYSIMARGVERAVLPTCRRHEIGVLVWAPLNGGWLTGKYRRDQPPPSASRAERQPEHFDHRTDWRSVKLGLVEQLAAIADDAGVSLTALALGFVLAHPAVSSALIGPRNPEQLTDLLAVADVRLAADVLAAIDAIVEPGTDVNPADSGYTPPTLDRANW